MFIIRGDEGVSALIEHNFLDKDLQFETGVCSSLVFLEDLVDPKIYPGYLLFYFVRTRQGDDHLKTFPYRRCTKNIYCDILLIYY